MVRMHRVTWAVLTALFLTAVVVVSGTRLLQAESPNEPAPQVPLTQPAAPLSPPTPPIPPDPTPLPTLEPPRDRTSAHEQPLREDPIHIQPLDIIKIQVIGTILDQPIDGYYLVEPDGQVPLGPAYGRANVNGLTVEQAEGKITQQLAILLAKPDVQVTKVGRASLWRGMPPGASYTISPGDLLYIDVVGSILDQPIQGIYMVEFSGTVALGPAYGRAKVQGLTLEEAEKAIQKKLKEVLAKPDAQVTFGSWGGFENVFSREVGPTSRKVGPPARASTAKKSPRPKTTNTIVTGESLGISVEKADLMGRVEWVMMHGGRDITARKTIEWGEVQKDEKGNRTIRYKFYATIWDRDVYVMNIVFTFDAKGNIISRENVEGFPKKKVKKPIDVNTQKGMKERVEDFFSKNFRDITSRKTIEWGEVAKTAEGNSSIRYKYRARIWDKENKIMNQVFTFNPKGEYVSWNNVEGFPKDQ